MDTGIQASNTEIKFVAQAFAGAGGRFAASSRPRFALIGRAILGRGMVQCTKLVSN